MAKTYLEQIGKAQVLLTGLKNCASRVKDKGIDDDFLTKLADNNKLATAYNEDFDRIKADLKAKTIQTNVKIAEIKLQIKQAKKIVKANFDKTEWKDFGINDKR